MVSRNSEAAAQRLMLALLISLNLAPSPIRADAAGLLPPPALGLAHNFRAGSGVDVARYWISEKLDGVRAYWDGRQLLSRRGKVLQAPEWFIAGFPDQPLDGELWLGRGQFERLVGVVRKVRPVDAEWRSVRYLVYDLPGAPGSFEQRLQRLQTLVAGSGSTFLVALAQFRLADEAALQQRLADYLAQGAEGLMLHRADAHFQAGRSDALLKLKPFDDDEATVLGYVPGQGKYQGMTGALQVQTADGRRFDLGSGLSDALRQNPPAIGSRVTYRYSGLTAQGLPRFPRYHRLFLGL